MAALNGNIAAATKTKIHVLSFRLQTLKHATYNKIDNKTNNKSHIGIEHATMTEDMVNNAPLITIIFFT